LSFAVASCTSLLLSPSCFFFPFSTNVPLPNLAACLSCSFMIIPLSIHTCSSSRSSESSIVLLSLQGSLVLCIQLLLLFPISARESL
jgi:hypothetical protein